MLHIYQDNIENGLITKMMKILLFVHLCSIFFFIFYFQSIVFVVENPKYLPYLVLYWGSVYISLREKEKNKWKCVQIYFIVVFNVFSWKIGKARRIFFSFCMSVCVCNCWNRILWLYCVCLVQMFLSHHCWVFNVFFFTSKNV